MSEEIKFEPVFGPQELFDTAQDRHSFAIQTRHGIHFYIAASTAIKSAIGMIEGECIQIAERRIIKAPVWTVADRQARRLPEVGSKCHYCNDADTHKTVIAVTRTHIVLDSETHIGPDVLQHDYFFQYYMPIETQEEKAHRLEDEFVQSVCSELDGTSLQHDCIYERGVRAAYRKTLELAATKGGE